MTSSHTKEHHKVIVIGAGFTGLSAAKNYLSINPSVDLLVIDGDDGIGGVWSSSRIYPGLYYEQTTPNANFSDFDMIKELGLGVASKITGENVNAFLLAYARKFDLLRRCRLSTEVTTIERDGVHWKILARPETGNAKSTIAFTCEKLIVATGLTSKPKLPDLDMGKFDGFSFHTVEMAHRHQEVTAPNTEHVTVVGSHKSAIEAVGTAVHAGKKVEWLVRENGGGAPWMLPNGGTGKPPKVQILSIRASSVVSTSVYHSDRWIDRFLHSGRWALGTWFINWFWNGFSKKMLGDHFTKSENGAKLKPDNPSLFWTGAGGATVLQARDQEVLRLMDEGEMIHVSRAHIISANGDTITLSTGENIKTDGVIFCTGWHIAAASLFPTELAIQAGLPVDTKSITESEKDYWTKLDSTEESELLKKYPQFQNPPLVRKQTNSLSPFRLYRSIIPPKLAAKGDNSLVFLGNYATGKLQMTTEICSLWAVAYLEGLLPKSTNSRLANKSEMDKDIALNQVYRTKRYLDGYSGVRVTLFETGEFHDEHLKDLGVRPDRKAMKLPTGLRGWFGWKGWKAEWFEPYSVDDYAGLIEEFVESVKAREGKEKLVNEQTPLLRSS